MSQIIGEGSEQDPRSLPLATKLGTWINNVSRIDRAPEVLDAAVMEWKNHLPNARLRSITATYNCFGMALAARRTWICADHPEMVLREDGYSLVSDSAKVMVGDLVVYRGNEGEMAHVGVVLEVKPRVETADFGFLILSKWGADGEYIHDVKDVPELFNQRGYEFHSERVDGDT